MPQTITLPQCMAKIYALFFSIVIIANGCAVQNNTTSSDANTFVNQDLNNPVDKKKSEEKLKRLDAEIAKRIAFLETQPKKTFISPSTREIGHAMYYAATRKRIEELGTNQFPEIEGKKLYGKLVISIPIFHDGTIYEKDGGPEVERSSGNAALDRFALDITRRAAPFENFPKNLRSNKDDVWVLIYTFNFMHTEDEEPKK